MSLTVFPVHSGRLYSNDAARTNKGYRPASICIELRDKTGHYGFVLPANQVRASIQLLLLALLPGFLFLLHCTCSYKFFVEYDMYSRKQTLNVRLCYFLCCLYLCTHS